MLKNLMVITLCLLAGISSSAMGQTENLKWERDVTSGIMQLKPGYSGGTSFLKIIAADPDSFYKERVKLRVTLGSRMEGQSPTTLQMVASDGFAGSPRLRIQIDTTRPDEKDVLDETGLVEIVGTIENDAQGIYLSQPRLAKTVQGGGGGSIVGDLGGDPFMLSLLIGAGVLLVVVIILMISMKRGRDSGGMTQTGLGAASMTGTGTAVPGGTTKFGTSDTVKTPGSENYGTVLSKTQKIQLPTPENAGGMKKTVKQIPGYFEVITGEGVGSNIRLFAEKTTVGRTSNNERRFGHIGVDKEEFSVSSRQAEVEYNRGSDTYCVVNLADPVSKNGTLINERAMNLNERADLNDGDVISMGYLTLKFHKA